MNTFQITEDYIKGIKDKKVRERMMNELQQAKLGYSESESKSLWEDKSFKDNVKMFGEMAATLGIVKLTHSLNNQ